jgi:two-component system chemotaxis response regulator CheB
VISVLVVDDSVVVRRLITDALADEAGLQVVGTAANGQIALSKIDSLKPDIVTMDIEMPVMDGITTVKELRKRHPRLPVIMFSTLSAAGATATLDALAAGASDYVTKPANVGSVAQSMRSVREQMVPRIHALCAKPSGRVAGLPGPPPPRPAGVQALTRPPAAGAPRVTAPIAAAPRAGAGTGRVEVITVGCSTGGPDALTQVLRSMPAALPVPIVVVQHMPPVFTKMFAERLHKASPLTVVEATADMTLTPGTVYVAPGDFHLEVQRTAAATVRTRLTTAPPENFCRPAVDVLFRSVERVYGGNALALVLTGMGQDGRAGCEVLRARGVEVVVQDEASSVVWGMPGAVVGAGLADVVLPIGEIAAHLTSRLGAGRSPRAAEARR